MLDEISLSDLAFAMELDDNEPSREVHMPSQPVTGYCEPLHTLIEGSCPFLQDAICLAELSSQEDVFCCARGADSLSSEAEDVTTDEHHNSSANASRTSSTSSASSHNDHIYSIPHTVCVIRGGRQTVSVSKRQRDSGGRGRCSSDRFDCSDDDDYKCSAIDLAAARFIWLPAGPVAAHHRASYVYAYTNPYQSSGGLTLRVA